MLALSEEGVVFGSGDSQFGQLGTGQKRQNSIQAYQELVEKDSEPISFFTNQLLRVIDIFCGSHHSAFLTQDSRVFMCGKGTEG